MPAGAVQKYQRRPGAAPEQSDSRARDGNSLDPMRHLVHPFDGENKLPITAQDNDKRRDSDIG
jgi:hypothetical protein